MFNYKPLLHLMVEKEISKKQLCSMLGCSNTTISKIAKNEYLSMEILDKICNVLECNIEDVVRHEADHQSEAGDAI